MSGEEADQILVRVVDESGSQGGSLRPPPGKDAKQQAFWNRNTVVKDVTIGVETLRTQIDGILGKLEAIFQTRASKPEPGVFVLTSFTVGLAITGTGRVVLVGELGVEASIEVTFERAKRELA